MKTITTKFLKILASILLGTVTILLLLQGVTPVYDFPKQRPFVGQSFFNPYARVDSVSFRNDFRKVNTHAHQTMANGMIEFSQYTLDEFRREYNQAGYAMALISDHQYINTNSPAPVYEHGINFSNYHLQCYGAESVCWIDFPIMLRPRSQMQWFVNHLRDQTPLMAVNHPSRLRMGFKPHHLTTLQGYDLIEMDHQRGGGAWDFALSAGHYSMLVATDDAHSRDSLHHRFQNRYTMVAISDTLSADKLFSTLKNGESYAVQLTVGVSPRGKGTEPLIKDIKMYGDTLKISLLQPAQEILLIGQNGEIRSGVENCDSVSYLFTPDDTYIRAEIYLANGMTIWTNPVARISALDKMTEPTVNPTLTILNSLLWIAVAIGGVWLIGRVWSKKRCR